MHNSKWSYCLYHQRFSWERKYSLSFGKYILSCRACSSLRLNEGSSLG